MHNNYGEENRFVSNGKNSSFCNKYQAAPLFEIELLVLLFTNEENLGFSYTLNYSIFKNWTSWFFQFGLHVFSFSNGKNPSFLVTEKIEPSFFNRDNPFLYEIVWDVFLIWSSYGF